MLAAKTAKKPEIGSMIHPTTANAKIQYPKTRGAGFCSFFDIALEC